MTEVEKITKEISKLTSKIDKLTKLRYEICPHNDIKYDSWCDDDYAQFWARTYTSSYKCLDCGLYASSKTINDYYNYDILKEAYERKHKI